MKIQLLENYYSGKRQPSRWFYKGEVFEVVEEFPNTYDFYVILEGGTRWRYWVPKDKVKILEEGEQNVDAGTTG